MRLSIAAALLVPSIASVARADPPRLVHRIELDTGGPEKARSYGMTFLPDGIHVAVRWGWERLHDNTSVAKLTVFGEPNRGAETIIVPPLTLREGLFGGRIAVSKSGGIVLPAGSTRLLVRPRAVAAGAAPTRPIEIKPQSPIGVGVPSHVWIGESDISLYVAARGVKAAYQFATVEGAPLKSGMGQAKLLLSGGPQEDMFVCADLHPSGDKFVAVHASLRGEQSGLDLWKLGDPPRKQSVGLVS